jgi:MshEN domain
MKLGTALVKEGLVTPEQLEEALKSQVIFGGKLGTNLIELGYLDEEQLMYFLSEKLDIPHAMPEVLTDIPADVIDIFSREMVETYKVIPVSFKNNIVDLLMLDPTDQEIVQELSSATGYMIHPMVAPEIQLFAAMEKYYGVQRDIRYISLESTQSDSVILTSEPDTGSSSSDPFSVSSNASQPSTYMDVDTDTDTSDIDFGEETMIERPADVPAAPQPKEQSPITESKEEPEESTEEDAAADVATPATESQTVPVATESEDAMPVEDTQEEAAQVAEPDSSLSQTAVEESPAEAAEVGETTSNLMQEEDHKLDRLSRVEQQLEELTATLPLTEILNEIKALRSEISDIRDQISERKSTKTDAPSVEQEVAQSPSEVSEAQEQTSPEQEDIPVTEESPQAEESDAGETAADESEPETKEDVSVESDQPPVEDSVQEDNEDEESESGLAPPPPVEESEGTQDNLDDEIDAGTRFLEEAIEDDEDAGEDEEALQQNRRVSPLQPEHKEEAEEGVTQHAEPEEEAPVEDKEEEPAAASEEIAEEGEDSTVPPPPLIDEPIKTEKTEYDPDFAPPTETDIDESIYDDDKPEPDLDGEAETEALDYFDDDTGRDEEEADIDSIFEVQRRLDQVKERDEIASVVLSYATHMTKRASIFILKRHMIQGWDGRGENLYREMVSRIKIPASVPSIFKTIIDSGQPYLGPMPDQPVNDKFLAVMGGIFPEDIFILPIYVRDKLICFFYADNGDGRTIDADAVEDLQLLDQRIANAFEMLIKKTRKEVIG